MGWGLVLLVSLPYSFIIVKHFKGIKCLFQCIVLYHDFQYQAFLGLPIRVFIIQFVTACHTEQFQVRLELYTDPGTSQVYPRTLLHVSWNNSSRPGNKKFLRCAQLFFSQVGPKIQKTSENYDKFDFGNGPNSWLMHIKSI